MKYRILLLLGVVTLAACHPKSPNAGQGSTVATVNGVAISRDLLDDFVRAATGGRTSADLSPEQRQRALDSLIRAQLIAQQAAKDGVAGEQRTQDMLELSRLNVLQQTMLERYLKTGQPTEQELRAEYDSQVEAAPHLEYHARHILVDTESFADVLVKQLDGGANFADLARKESTDSSKSNGGDIGWFTPDHMDKPFADAVVQLKPGTYTHAPVHTQYGWHIIYLEGTRTLAPPPYDAVKQRIEQIVVAKKFKAYTDDLMKNAKVTKNI